MRSTLLGIIATASVVLATAAPALAAGSGSVAISVTGSAPCITVAGQFAFGTVGFSAAGSGSASPGSGATVTNCSGSTESYVAHVSNLSNGNINWTPGGNWGNPCPTLNVFNLTVGLFGSPTGGTSLTSTDQAVGSSSSATPADWSSELTMPCAGSTGAGLPMSGQITLTASF